MATPERFADEIVFNVETLPKVLKQHEAAALSANVKDRALHGYCPVSIVEGLPVDKCKGSDLNVVVYGKHPRFYFVSS